MLKYVVISAPGSLLSGVDNTVVDQGCGQEGAPLYAASMHS